MEQKKKRRATNERRRVAGKAKKRKKGKLAARQARRGRPRGRAPPWRKEKKYGAEINARRGPALVADADGRKLMKVKREEAAAALFSRLAPRFPWYRHQRARCRRARAAGGNVKEQLPLLFIHERFMQVSRRCVAIRRMAFELKRSEFKWDCSEWKYLGG